MSPGQHHCAHKYSISMLIHQEVHVTALRVHSTLHQHYAEMHSTRTNLAWSFLIAKSLGVISAYVISIVHTRKKFVYSSEAPCVTGAIHQAKKPNLIA
eukprot:7645-Heterococcus_DN1.PRE.3